MREIGIGLIGAGWMGKAHTVAYRNVPLVFGPEPAIPRLEMVADINPEWARAAAESLGFARWAADWRTLVDDPRVDVVDITTPNDVHAEIALAALAAGKPVYCEKPLANSAAETRAMAEAAEAAGVTTLVGFNYLKNPAHPYARDLIQAGALGRITLFRGTFDQDVMSDPAFPFTWRADRMLAGSGALGDMGSPAIWSATSWRSAASRRPSSASGRSRRPAPARPPAPQPARPCVRSRTRTSASS
jgi:predicted dehydrogenase